MRFQLIKLATAVACIVPVLGLSAHETKAATLTLTSVTGLWSNVQGGQNVAIVPPGAGDPTTLSWGNPIPGVRSSYVFDGLPGGPYAVGVDFTLGTFTHNNFPIPSGSGITGANLTAEFQGSVDGNPFDVSSVYQFTHDETPNVGGNNCCNDIVTAVTNPGGSTSLLIGGVEYIFAFTGFLVGGDTFTQFSTVENQSNVANLQGVLIEKSLVNPVPLPAALPLFAGGLGCLALLGRRKRKQKAES